LKCNISNVELAINKIIRGQYNVRHLKFEARRATKRLGCLRLFDVTRVFSTFVAMNGRRVAAMIAISILGLRSSWFLGCFLLAKVNSSVYPFAARKIGTVAIKVLSFVDIRRKCYIRYDLREIFKYNVSRVHIVARARRLLFKLHIRYDRVSRVYQSSDDELFIV
jgi:hypothetical protein